MDIGTKNSAVNATVQNFSPRGAPCCGGRECSKRERAGGRSGAVFRLVRGASLRGCPEKKCSAPQNIRVEGRVKCEGLRWELARCFQGRVRRSEWLACQVVGQVVGAEVRSCGEQRVEGVRSL